MMNRQPGTHAMVLALSLTMAASLGFLTGCATHNSPTAQRERPLQQTQSIEVVRLRAQQLKPGMSKAEVFLKLGAPAQYRGDSWIYQNGDQQLTVQFRDDHYLTHSLN